jgi:hypothetical protein
LTILDLDHPREAPRRCAGDGRRAAASAPPLPAGPHGPRRRPPFLAEAITNGKKSSCVARTSVRAARPPMEIHPGPWRWTHLGASPRQRRAGVRTLRSCLTSELIRPRGAARRRACRVSRSGSRTPRAISSRAQPRRSEALVLLARSLEHRRGCFGRLSDDFHRIASLLLLKLARAVIVGAPRAARNLSEILGHQSVRCSRTASADRVYTVAERTSAS